MTGVQCRVVRDLFNRSLLRAAVNRYRIVDEARRAFTLAVILLPVLASVVQITGPKAMFAGFPAP
jgi:hypothetical protein